MKNLFSLFRDLLHFKALNGEHILSTYLAVLVCCY